MTSWRPGPRNRITDVPGIRIGQAEDRRAWTGTTVVLPEAPVVAGVDVRGGAPGTRETDALDPTCLVEHIHAVVLSGGSAFGLDAAGAVAVRLASRGIGFRFGNARVPVVPSAILFDLLNGGDKGWGEAPPYRGLGLAALAAAEAEEAPGGFALGNAGAGYGAKAGRLKGGLGSASLVLDGRAENGLAVGALVAANPSAIASVVMPGTNCFWAWALERDGEFGGVRPPADFVLPIEDEFPADPTAAVGGNTTIAVVATDAALDKAEAQRLAIMAHDGLARAIRPAHTPFDGDTVFALATGARPLGANRPWGLARLGAAAADCLARAIARAIYEAEPLGAWPAWRDLAPR
jgi:L-aminopeptidase/D-esterase-like protein